MSRTIEVVGADVAKVITSMGQTELSVIQDATTVMIVDHSHSTHTEESAVGSPDVALTTILTALHVRLGKVEALLSQGA